MLTFYPTWIPDPGVKKAPDPGSASATLVFCDPLFLRAQVETVGFHPLAHGIHGIQQNLKRP
jgi:hypothetical protein